MGYQIIKVGRDRRRRFTAAVVVSAVSEMSGRRTTAAGRRCLSAMHRGLAGQLFLVDVTETGAVEREVAINVYAREIDRVVFLCASEEIAAAVASTLQAYSASEGRDPCPTSTGC